MPLKQAIEALRNKLLHITDIHLAKKHIPEYEGVGDEREKAYSMLLTTVQLYAPGKKEKDPVKEEALVRIIDKFYEMDKEMGEVLSHGHFKHSMAGIFKESKEQTSIQKVVAEFYSTVNGIFSKAGLSTGLELAEIPNAIQQAAEKADDTQHLAAMLSQCRMNLQPEITKEEKGVNFRQQAIKALDDQLKSASESSSKEEKRAALKIYSIFIESDKNVQASYRSYQPQPVEMKGDIAQQAFLRSQVLHDIEKFYSNEYEILTIRQSRHDKGNKVQTSVELLGYFTDESLGSERRRLLKEIADPQNALKLYALHEINKAKLAVRMLGDAEDNQNFIFSVKDVARIISINAVFDEMNESKALKKLPQGTIQAVTKIVQKMTGQDLKNSVNLKIDAICNSKSEPLDKIAKITQLTNDFKAVYQLVAGILDICNYSAGLNQKFVLELVDKAHKIIEGTEAKEADFRVILALALDDLKEKCGELHQAHTEKFFKWGQKMSRETEVLVTLIKQREPEFEVLAKSDSQNTATSSKTAPEPESEDNQTPTEHF